MNFWTLKPYITVIFTFKKALKLLTQKVVGLMLERYTFKQSLKRGYIHDFVINRRENVACIGNVQVLC